ncbi:hypothetical protein [Bifidobacterium vespertilionis]|uniref:hypothetical protein n=1 Tax=Bifidobacterium vespertilionis TaxID=2562524 RepID=UPI001BDD55EE|nr:hypothetical protein [Bifidobacterium vespertilionis]MBT1178615.1 hypothetical protein [Bifidobacterium vespertilionis]
MGLGANFLHVTFTRNQSNPDVTVNRRDARRIAGHAIRAIAHALQAGRATDITIALHADPLADAITGASLIRLAQSIDPKPTPPGRSMPPRRGCGADALADAESKTAR